MGSSGEVVGPGQAAGGVVAAVKVVVVQDGLLVGVGSVRGGSGSGGGRGSRRGSDRGGSGGSSGHGLEFGLGGRRRGGGGCGCAAGFRLNHGGRGSRSRSRGGLDLSGVLLGNIESGKGSVGRLGVVLLDQNSGAGSVGGPLGDSLGDGSGSPLGHVNLLLNNPSTSADRQGGNDDSRTHFGIEDKETSPGSFCEENGRIGVKQIDCFDKGVCTLGINEWQAF